MCQYFLKFTFFSSALILLSLGAQAQNPWANDFNHDTISDKHLGTIILHISKTRSAEKLPLLIFIDGSGNYPLFYRTNKGGYNTSVALNIHAAAKAFRVVLISKPGIPFSDSLRYDQRGRAYYPGNETYDKYYSLDWRAGAASKAIDFLVKRLAVDQKHIVVMGHSEGAQVAPAVAVRNRKVTQVVCLAGNGLNQLYDFLINARLDAAKHNMTAEQGQLIVDSLYREYAKIYAEPNSTEKKWYGATYRKWSSFSESTPLENMLKLDIPILYIAGGKDNNQTIIDMDYVKLEFLRKHKTNLAYQVYPDCDHYFQETIVKDGKEVRTNRLDEVIQVALDWVQHQR